MISNKSVSIALAVITLVGLIAAIPTGVMLPLQTARAQIGEGDDDIANIVDETLNTAFSAAGINDEEEEEEEDEEETATEEAAAEAEEQTAGDDIQDIDQTQTQRNEQDQDAEQEVDQESSQDETNIQANELDTGDNTATVAQSNDVDEEDDDDQDDGGQDVTAVAEASDEEEEDSDSTDTDATAEAIGIVDQSNTATVRQNSSISGVDLSNNVVFGDDTNTQIAVPIIDQEQEATNEAEQRAANLDVEETTTVLQPTPTPTTTEPTPTVFCLTLVSTISGQSGTECFSTLSECLTRQAAVEGGATVDLVSGCRGFVTAPPGARPG
jgi:hypothetical protein